MGPAAGVRPGPVNWLASPNGPAAGNWVFAAVLEALERLSGYSSFFTGPSALQRLELIQQLGFASPEMQRRLSLVKQRLGRATA